MLFSIFLHVFSNYFLTSSVRFDQTPFFLHMEKTAAFHFHVIFWQNHTGEGQKKKATCGSEPVGNQPLMYHLNQAPFTLEENLLTPITSGFCLQWERGAIGSHSQVKRLQKSLVFIGFSSDHQFLVEAVKT